MKLTDELSAVKLAPKGSCMISDIHKYIQITLGSIVKTWTQT